MKAIKFSNHSLIDFTTDWQSLTHTWHAYHPVQVLISHHWHTVSVPKIDPNTWRTAHNDWPAQGFVTCLTHLPMILCKKWFRFVHKSFLKIIFKCNSEKSDVKVHYMFLNHGFWSVVHSQCCPLAVSTLF